MGALFYLALLGTAPLKTVEVQTEYLDYFTREKYNTSGMAFTRQKAIAGANPEYAARTQPGTNIREGSYPKLTVLIQET